jgi:hypothetical protein
MANHPNRKKKKRFLSYEEIAKMPMPELEELADAGILDDETLARVAHFGRFTLAVGEAMPNPELMVGDVFTEDELQEIWQQTADEGVDVGRYPLLH